MSPLELRLRAAEKAFSVLRNDIEAATAQRRALTVDAAIDPMKRGEYEAAVNRVNVLEQLRDDLRDELTSLREQVHAEAQAAKDAARLSAEAPKKAAAEQARLAVWNHPANAARLINETLTAHFAAQGRQVDLVHRPFLTKQLAGRVSGLNIRAGNPDLGEPIWVATSPMALVSFVKENADRWAKMSTYDFEMRLITEDAARVHAANKARLGGAIGPSTGTVPY